MKRITPTLIVCMVGFLTAFADKDPEDFKVIVYRADGTQFEGYNDTQFEQYLKPKVTSVYISSEFKGPAVKYSSDEVKRVEFIASTMDSIPMIFEAVKAQAKLPNLFSKNPKPYKEPVFLRLIYDGENVKGYAMPYTDHTFTHKPNIMTVHYTWRYFYLTKDSDVAKAYWDDTDGVVPNMNKVMKFYFREFPDIVKMIDNDELTPEMFRENPAIVLPLMDKTYSPKSK